MNLSNDDPFLPFSTVQFPEFSIRPLPRFYYSRRVTRFFKIAAGVPGILDLSRSVQSGQ